MVGRECKSSTIAENATAVATNTTVGFPGRLAGGLGEAGDHRIPVEKPVGCSHERIGNLTFPVQQDQVYQVMLDLISKDGKTLAHNVYTDPFHHPKLPKGYPARMDRELGMRLWWAGMAE